MAYSVNELVVEGDQDDLAHFDAALRRGLGVGVPDSAPLFPDLAPIEDVIGELGCAIADLVVALRAAPDELSKNALMDGAPNLLTVGHGFHCQRDRNEDRVTYSWASRLLPIGFVWRLLAQYPRLWLAHRWIEPISGLVGRIETGEEHAAIVIVGARDEAPAVFDDELLASHCELWTARMREPVEDAATDYYIVDVGTETVIALDDCAIIGIRRSNVRARWALDDDDVGAAMESADYNGWASAALGHLEGGTSHTLQLGSA